MNATRPRQAGIAPRPRSPAFKGVRGAARPVILITPVGVEIAHRRGPIVRMAVPGAENDGLLFRSAGGE